MTRIVVRTAARPQGDALRAVLQSYATHVEDAPAVPVHVVAARDDLRALEALLAEFGGLDVHARALEDLLEPAGHGETAAELVRAVGRGTADALARLYALAALPFDQALVLDADGLAVGPVRLTSVFDAYSADPRVFYSDPAVWGEAWFGSTPDAVVKTAARMLGVPYPDTYFGEYRGGFYEKRVVRDVFAALGGDPQRIPGGGRAAARRAATGLDVRRREPRAVPVPVRVGGRPAPQPPRRRRVRGVPAHARGRRARDRPAGLGGRGRHRG